MFFLQSLFLKKGGKAEEGGSAPSQETDFEVNFSTASSGIRRRSKHLCSRFFLPHYSRLSHRLGSRQMNHFLSRTVLSCLIILAVSSSRPWAQSWAAVSPSNSSVITPIATQPSVVAPASTVIPAATPIVTSVATSVATAVATTESESPTLSEVVVTANRVGVPVQNVTSSSTLITSQEMQQKQEGTALDAIQGVPGVDINQTGQPGETAFVYIRGNGSENTLVLYDGMPLNDPIGAPFDYEYLDGLTLDGIQQIEVLRGPQSTLWGSNAIGGVINIIPQSGPSPLGGSVLMEGGSYGTSREVVSAQGGDNGGYFNFDASHYNTAGFPALDVKGLDPNDAAQEGSNAGSVNNGDDNNSASLRLGSNLASNLDEKILVRYNQSNTSIDEYNNNVLYDDPLAFALQEQFMVDSRTNWKLLDGSWEQQLNISFSDDNRIYNETANPYNSTSSNSDFDGQTAQISWQNNIHLAKEETIIVGIQGQEEWGNEASTYDSVPVTTVQTGSGFAESQTSIDDQLFFNLGGRWDANSAFGTHTTYQAGLAYVVPGVETKLKANYGTGFLAPNLYQLYDPTYGNPNLQPETSLGYDIGFEQPIGGKNFINLGADYFDNDLTNLISYNPSTYVSENIGQARSYGVESYADFKGISNLDVKGSYTYTYAWDISNYTPLARRPQNKASGDIDYKWGDASFGTSLVYTGSAFDTDFSGNGVTLPSYFLVNLRASYQVNSQVKLFARVDNLFNQWYEDAYGFSTPGLSIYGGTKISF
jgi:vitamin B12 transporter